MSRNYSKQYNNERGHNNQGHNNQGHNNQGHRQSQHLCFTIELNDFKDVIFDAKNLIQFTKHIITTSDTNIISKKDIIIKEKRKDLEKEKEKEKEKKPLINLKPTETTYNPCQKDSLFWCLFILKHGISKYEMELGNQHFVVEKQEKFKYIESIRKNKEVIKMHKIKPLSGLEDDLANKDRITIKTFLALCVIENINILLVDKRKIYEIIMNDEPKINVVHRNSTTYEHYIELDVNKDAIEKYKNTYYKMSSFDDSLKSMTSYKVEELLELCNKLNIDLLQDNKEKGEKGEKGQKKRTKKDIYELIVMNF
jgi:hypothetical protein